MKMLYLYYYIVISVKALFVIFRIWCSVDTFDRHYLNIFVDVSVSDDVLLRIARKIDLKIVTSATKFF